MRNWKRAIREAFPGAEFPKNFIPLFPDRFLLPTEARDMVGGEKELDRMRRTYPDLIRAYERGEKGTATKFRLWELQDAILQSAKDEKEKTSRSTLNGRP